MKFLPASSAHRDRRRSLRDGPARTAACATVLRRRRPGDIAVIDHLDLDRSSAEALLDHGVAAVVNASPFISGRYPNLGPELLAAAGVVLVDDVGPEVFSRLKDGARAGSTTAPSTSASARSPPGRRSSLDDVREQMDNAREGLSTPAAELHPQHHRVPPARAGPAAARPGRPRAAHPDGRAARSWSSSATSTTRRTSAGCGASSGSSARCWSGSTAAPTRSSPPSSAPTWSSSARAGFSVRRRFRAQAVSDEALTKAGEVLLHADASDRVVGAERLDRLGVRAQRIAAERLHRGHRAARRRHQGRLADRHGRHPRDPRRVPRPAAQRACRRPSSPGCRSGPRVVDAKSVPPLYAGRVRLWHLLLVLLVGLLAVAAGSRGHPRRGSSGPPSSATPRESLLDTCARTALVISFRYHVVSLLAVLLALAAGIALGSGPLQRDAVRRVGGQRRGGARGRRRPRRAARGGRGLRRRRTPTRPPGTLLGGELDGRAVTLVSLPGAADATVTGLTDMVARGRRRGHRTGVRRGEVPRRRQPAAGRRARHPDARLGQAGRATCPPARAATSGSGCCSRTRSRRTAPADEPVDDASDRHPRRARHRRSRHDPGRTSTGGAAWCWWSPERRTAARTSARAPAASSRRCVTALDEQQRRRRARRPGRVRGRRTGWSAAAARRPDRGPGGLHRRRRRPRRRRRRRGAGAGAAGSRASRPLRDDEAADGAVPGASDG